MIPQLNLDPDFHSDFGEKIDFLFMKNVFLQKDLRDFETFKKMSQKLMSNFAQSRNESY